MSIRLSKACKDLNVGMTTAIEFLAKKAINCPSTLIWSCRMIYTFYLQKNLIKIWLWKWNRSDWVRNVIWKKKAGTVALEGYNKQQNP